MQEQIFDLLLQQEDVTWKSLLYDLVQQEGMDPWNINITLLTQKYIQVIKEMKEHDFRISGKILLAAAILLKIKSTHLLENDIAKLDLLISQAEDEEDIEEDLFSSMAERSKRDPNQYTLIHRTPQPRQRKVSIQDLVEALQRTMKTKKRLLAQQRPAKFKMPKKGTDIMEVIRDIYHKISYYSKKDKSKTITFTRLLPSRPKRHDKVFTFLPLLHLENQHKVATTQREAFAEIHINLCNGKS